MGEKSEKAMGNGSGSSLLDTVLAKEREMVEAYKGRDLKALESLMAEEFLGISLTPDGEPFVGGRTQMSGILVTVGIDEYEIREPRVLVLSSGAVLISYLGRAVTAMGVLAGPISSIWVKRGKEWKNIFWQLTPNMKESFRPE